MEKSISEVTKYFFISLVICRLFYQCANEDSRNHRRIIHAEHTTYEEYNGKVIKSIKYFKKSDPYTLEIKFTDGTILNVCANKYVLDVEKK